MNILNNRPIIIGIDHDYGNIKTAIGEEHKEFTADKMADSDYYILTLAAIGRELNIRSRPWPVSIWRQVCPSPGSVSRRTLSSGICCKGTARILLSVGRSTMLTLPEPTFSPRALPLSLATCETSVG